MLLLNFLIYQEIYYEINHNHRYINIYQKLNQNMIIFILLLFKGLTLLKHFKYIKDQIKKMFRYLK